MEISPPKSWLEQYASDGSPTPPTYNQLYNSAVMNWVYAGGGIFKRGDQLGYFTERGFKQI